MKRQTSGSKLKQINKKYMFKCLLIAYTLCIECILSKENVVKNYNHELSDYK